MAWRAGLLATLLIGLSGPGLGAGAGVERAAPRTCRTVFEGTITEVMLAPSRTGRALQGLLCVEAVDGARKRFRVQTFTLILVRDRDGRLWAGRLRDLDHGWVCSVAFDLQNESDDGSGDKDADETIEASHLIAQAP